MFFIFDLCLISLEYCHGTPALVMDVTKQKNMRAVRYTLFIKAEGEQPLYL